MTMEPEIEPEPCDFESATAFCGDGAPIIEILGGAFTFAFIRAALRAGIVLVVPSRGAEH